MAEGIGKYFSFVWALVEYFYEAFFVGTREFFALAMDGPFARPWEFIIAVFFILAAACFVLGVVWSVMKRSPRPFIYVSEKFNRFFGWIGAYLIIILIGTMVYEVIARYFFQTPTKWAFEVGYMLMGTSFMLGIAVCMQMGQHVRVDFVYDAVSPRWRAVIELIGFFFMIPMMLWLSAGLWDYFVDAYRVNERSGESAWNPIIWPFKFIFVVGFVLLLIQCVVEIIKCIMTLCGFEPPQPEKLEGAN